jgi:branched-chain amino acid transport system permease protein
MPGSGLRSRSKLKLDPGHKARDDVQAASPEAASLQLAVNIFVLASIYALIACGYVLVYRVSRVLNLAHGELMMLGAYALMLVASQFSSYWPAAIAAAVGLSLLTGVLVYLFLMRKMTGEMVLAAVLTTVALGTLLRGVMVLVWSAQQQYPAQALGVVNTSIALPGGARISFFSMLLVLTTALVYGSLLSFLRFGRWGIRMRAAGQSPLLAAQRGINLHAVYALAWGLSTLTGSLAGILIALDSGLDQTMAIIGLKAFPAALVGGLDSLVGALAGSLIVAGAEVLLIHYVDPLLSEVVPFLVLIAMLVVRPWGLFGTREELDRV